MNKRISLRKTLIVSFAALMVSVTSTASIYAHSSMKENTPKTGTTVKVGVDQVGLVFSKKVRLTKFEMFMHGETFEPTEKNADTSDLEAVELPEKPSKKFQKMSMVEVGELESGSYFYKWIGVAMDGHKMNGQGHFSVED